MDINKLLKQNAINSDLDYLSLSRNLTSVPRSQVLNFVKKQSVSEHTLNCLFLVDWLNGAGYITPALDSTSEIKEYLQYHDLPESLTGDVPKIIDFDDDEELFIELIFQFGVKSEYDKDLLQLAKQIDILEFLLTLEQEFFLRPFVAAKLLQVLQNGVEIWSKEQTDSIYKIVEKRTLFTHPTFIAKIGEV